MIAAPRSSGGWAESLMRAMQLECRGRNDTAGRGLRAKSSVDLHFGSYRYRFLCCKAYLPSFSGRQTTFRILRGLSGRHNLGDRRARFIVAAIAHLDDVLLGNVYSTSQSGAFILGLFRDRVSSLPDREWERLARANLLEGARLDASHPPTAYRRSFLRAHAVEKPRITATEDVMRAIDAELSTLQETLGKRLIARHACE